MYRELAHVEGGKAVLFELEWWCALFNFIPYVLELVLSQVPIEWRVINMNIYGLLYVPGDLMWLPVKYGKTFRAYCVSCTMAMVAYWGWSPVVFLDPVPKESTWFPYVFLWTVDVWAFKSIYNPYFFKFLSLSLGDMRRVLMMLVPLKCTLIPKLLHVLLNLSPVLWM